jgi:hypothetical protein
MAQELVCRIYPHAWLIDWSFAAGPANLAVRTGNRLDLFGRDAAALVSRKRLQEKPSA